MKTVVGAFSVIVKLREGSCPALLLTAPLWPRCSAACVCLRHYLATEMLITIAADLFLPLLLRCLLPLPDPDPDQQLCSIYSLVPGDYQLMWVIMSIMTSGMLSRPVSVPQLRALCLTIFDCQIVQIVWVSDQRPAAAWHQNV